MTLAKLQHPAKILDKGREVRGWSKPAMPLKRKPVPLFKEYSRVGRYAKSAKATMSVPAGATGTIVHVVRGGVGYQVEFTAPKHLVISARPSDLGRA